jgi:predicted GIY-YIG superfamily endonuclease
MPKVPHDFSNEMIFYIIKSNDLEKTDIYVGSTFNFTKRKNQHKSGCNNPNHTNYNLKIYIYIRENGGWDAFTMTMLDRKICVDMLEARKHEQTLITQYKANLNTNKAFGAETREEYLKQWHSEHKEEIVEYKHNYYLEHAEAYAEKGKQYYIEHKEECAERNNQWRIKNADKISENNKKLRIKNDDKLKEKITCECGQIGSRQHISRHIKSKKHLAYLATKESVEIS